MHVNPYLIIEDEKYLVDDFTFGFSQKPNAVGLPATFPVFQGLDVVIRGHYPGFFLERWACASSQPKLIELVLKPLVLGSGPTRVFTFFDAHLVHFTKNYSEKKNPPVEMHLKITAGGVRDSFSKSEYSAPWRETFEKPSIVAAQSTTEEECVDAGQEEQATRERAPWMKIAYGELGVEEVYGSEHNKRILEYHKSAGLKDHYDKKGKLVKITDDKGWPWCSSFACWVFSQVDTYSGKITAKATNWKNCSNSRFAKINKFKLLELTFC